MSFLPILTISSVLLQAACVVSQSKSAATELRAPGSGNQVVAITAEVASDFAVTLTSAASTAVTASSPAGS